MWLAGGFPDRIASVSVILFNSSLFSPLLLENYVMPLLHPPLFFPPPNKQEVGLGMETVLRRLRDTQENSEIIIYLLSLQNALLPETIPTLLHYAEEGSAVVSSTAVSALQRFSSQYITGEVWNEPAKNWSFSLLV